MTDMSSTRANRRVLIAGLVCAAALLAVAALLDQQGVRFSSSLPVMLVALSVFLAVVLFTRGRRR